MDFVLNLQNKYIYNPKYLQKTLCFYCSIQIFFEFLADNQVKEPFTDMRISVFNFAPTFTQFYFILFSAHFDAVNAIFNYFPKIHSHVS